MEGPDVFPFLLIFREEVDCLGLVLDFAFFAVLLVCIIVAAKRGFVLSLMELVGFFLAGACALSLSGLIAPEIYDRFFAQQVTQAIAARLPDLSGAATAAQQAHAALESLPDVIAQFAASLGIDTAALAQKILSADLSGAALAQTLADSIARPLVTLLCRTWRRDGRAQRVAGGVGSGRCLAAGGKPVRFARRRFSANGGIFLCDGNGSRAPSSFWHRFINRAESDHISILANQQNVWKRVCRI